MTAVFVLLLLVAICFGVAAWREDRRRLYGPSPEQKARLDAIRAAGQVEEEFLNARRAMNDAAGQGWRNLTD